MKSPATRDVREVRNVFERTLILGISLNDRYGEGYKNNQSGMIT
jgi:hypothetical protein